MVENIKWDENGGYGIEDPKKAIQNKTADAPTINAIMNAIFKELGFEVSPVLISTRGHGKINTAYCLDRYYNYFLNRVVIGKDTLLVDATSKYIKMGSLPQRCMNYFGRHLPNIGPGEFIEIKSPDKYGELDNYEVNLDKNGNIKGHIINNNSGFAAEEFRNGFKELKPEDYSKIAQKVAKNAIVSNVKVENLFNPQADTKFEFDFEIKAEEEAPDHIYIEPGFYSKIEKNPFSNKTRLYPIDFGHATHNIYIVKINIPENYEIEEMPKGMNMALPDNAGKFIYNFIVQGNSINIVSRLTINKSYFEAEMAEPFSQFYSRLVAKQNEHIVLRKKQ